jgi:hypothetical protein
LHFSSCPAAIPWRVRAIVVNAVECEFWVWPPSHIGKKIDIIVPTWVNRYASAAVVFVGLALRVVASLAQSVPCFVFRCNGMADGVPVFDGKSHSETTAGFSNSSLYIASKGDCYFSAVALTTESSKVVFGVKERKDKKAVETLVDNFNMFRHAR